MLHQAGAVIPFGGTGKPRWRRDWRPDDSDLALSLDLNIGHQLSLMPGHGRDTYCDPIARELRRERGGLDTARGEVERYAPFLRPFVHAKLSCVCGARDEAHARW